MTINLVFVFIFLNSASLLAQTIENPVLNTPFIECYDPNSYISGENCYLKYNKPEYSNNEWKFLEVPVDYNSPDSQKTKISFRTNLNFSLNKKTILFFNGGPGGTSYGTNFASLNDVNIIYFNQRGAAFSRPETNELFLNQDYYSSENTARDALEIVKSLGVKKVSSYGHSYGTIPATIFGSLFPEHTENVILEGVIYDGTTALWKASHRIKLLQKYFDQLNQDLKENILKYSRHPDVFSGWFSVLAQEIMYDSNFKKKLNESLNELFFVNINSPVEQKEKAIIDHLKFLSFRNTGTINEMVYFSPTMFNFIGCKELSAGDDYASFYAVFNDANKLIPYKKPIDLVNYCQKLNITKSKTYLATDYPLQVPTYYFQGTTDGATTVENAIWHYKRVAKNKAYLVLSKNQGHSAVIETLMQGLNINLQGINNPYIAERTERVKLFIAAINNQEIQLKELNKIINDKTKFWVKTQK